MKIFFNLPDERIITFDASETTLLSGLRLMVSLESGIPDNDVLLMKNGSFIMDKPDITISEANLCEDDFISVSRKKLTLPPTASPSNSLDPVIDFSSITLPGKENHRTLDLAESARQHFLSAPPNQKALLRQHNPELWEAINNSEAFGKLFNGQRTRALETKNELRNLEHADQLDPQVQQRIAELIKQKNIDVEMEAAMEYYPETFGQVTMLYINCEVNGFPIKAFVDSGAQTTIMSMACSRRCNLDRLIDTRWAGMAYGVGTQTIIGRVHQAEMRFGNTLIPTSFVILDNQPMDLMIGLDMLKRHKCSIDLLQNVLKIGTNLEVPFLPESELPSFARHPEQNLPSASSMAQDALNDDQEVKVTILTSQSIPREDAIQLLKGCNWDSDVAFSKYHNL